MTTPAQTVVLSPAPPNTEKAGVGVGGLPQQRALYPERDTTRSVGVEEVCRNMAALLTSALLCSAL
jgi:hypothetical protein